ncbi:MAG: DUF5658 family protein [Haloarculaceae archaeon]
MLPLVPTDLTGVDSLGVDERVLPVLGSTSDVELALWAVAIAALVLDVVTTAYGLSIGLVEQNPLMRYALDTFGLLALGVVKGLALTVALAVYHAFPEYALIVPIGLALPWGIAVVVNVSVIMSV